MGSTYCGASTVEVPYPIVFITSVAPGTYKGAYKPAETLNWLDWGSKTVGVSPCLGNVFSVSAVVPEGPEEIALFALGANLITGSALDTWGSVQWTPSSGTPAGNPYIFADPVLTAAPGDSKVTLTWSAPPACLDGTQLVYELRRSNSPTMSGAVLITRTTTLAFTDTGRVNGTTYYYRVTADIQCPGASTGFSFGRSSSIVAAVPLLLREYWGAIST